MRTRLRKYCSYAKYLIDKRGFFAANHVSGALDRSVAVLTFDVDSSLDVAALPGLMDLLREAGLTAGFAVVGEWLLKHVQEHRLIVEGGHEVMNHGFANHCPESESGTLFACNFLSDLDLAGQTREIERGHQAIVETLGVAPRGFRGAHFSTLNKNQLESLYPVLRELGYLYCSSATFQHSPHGRGFPVLAGGIVELPVTTCPDHPFSPFDSWHFLEAPERGHEDEDLPRCLGELLGMAEERPGFFVNIYLDPRAVVGSHHARKALEALAASRVQKALPADVAQVFLEAAGR